MADGGEDNSAWEGAAGEEKGQEPPLAEDLSPIILQANEQAEETQFDRNSLAEGKVFVHKKVGWDQYAQLILADDDRVFIPTLQDLILLPDATIVEAERQVCRVRPRLRQDIAGAGCAGREPPLAGDLGSIILQANELAEETQLNRNSLTEGKVFVHKKVGWDQYTQLILEDDDRVFIPALQDPILPPDATFVELDNVVPPLSPLEVFLELQWPHNGQRGRVCIELFPNTILGVQVLALFTGEYGHSYRNTPLASVGKLGEDGETVSGGYDDDEIVENMPFQTSGRENMHPPQWEGDVCALEIDNVWNAQFSIITKGLERPAERGAVFGRVVEGLNVVKEAAHYHPVTDIEVVECGVVMQGR